MSLVDLPPELLLRVSTFLSTSELGKFRLTSKHVEAVLFDSFAREFFTKKQFMLEQISLQALIDIANHPTLAPRLSEVVISTHVFPSDPEIITSFGKAMYDAAYVAHAVLMASGQALNMLSDAFSKLPNLRTVGLRDYNGRGRYREGDLATWKSWGWSFGWDRFPFYNSEDEFDQRPLRLISPEPIFPVLFYALGHARVLPESVHVFLRKRPKLAQQSFNMLDGYLGDKVKPVLGNIRELMLAIGCDTLAYDFRQLQTGKTPTKIPLSRLLQRTPKIETLRLNFEPNNQFGSGFLSWLGSPVPSSLTIPATIPASSVTDPVSLPRLTALELGMVTVPAAVLLKCLTKFDLKSLSLWKVKLNAPSADGPEDCWQELLHDLATALQQGSRLKFVMIGFPSQIHRHMESMYLEKVCYFKPVGAAKDDTCDESELTQEAKHYAGPGTRMADWLEGLSKRTFVPAVEDESDSDHEGLEDGEGEDAEEDDEDDD